MLAHGSSKPSLNENSTSLEARCSPPLGQEEVNKAHGYSPQRKRTASSTSGMTLDRQGQQVGLEKVMAVKQEIRKE